MPFRLARNVRGLQRLRAIAQVLTRHGFGHLVERLDLVRFVPLRMRPRSLRDREGHEALTVGQRLALVCSDLGPTFVKLGQMLSTRPDLLPPDITSGLRSLQDHVPPFSSDVAQQIIEEDLGAASATAFAEFEAVPCASGSISQVHRATTRDGQAVVVKIRRPNIEAVIRTDMHVLRTLAEAMETYLPEVRPYHPVDIIEEFRRTISLELDFINEASTTARFRQLMEGDLRIRIPEVRWDLTAPRVLTLERLEGVGLLQVLDGNAPKIDKQLLAENIAGVFMTQYFELGLFHADPHPGNLLIEPPARVGLIDFGMVGQVSEETRTLLLVGLVAGIRRQVEWVVDVLAEMGTIGPDTVLPELRRDIQVLLDKYYGLPIRRLDLSTIVVELIDVVRRNNVTLPRDFVLMAKSLGMTAGTVLQLAPELNLVELIQSHLKRLLKQRFTLKNAGQSLGFSVWQVLNILRSAPAQIRTSLRQLSQGNWQVKILHQNLDRLGHDLDRSSNRLAFAMIISSTIIGSSVLLTSDPQKMALGIPLNWFGIAGYLAAGVMGLWLAWAIMRSGRLH